METNAAERWIYTTLSADAALTGIVGTRIYNEVRPRDSALPCVLFQSRPSGRGDLTLLGAIRVWTEIDYLIRGIHEFPSGTTGHYSGDVEKVASRIDTLLHGSSGLTAAGQVFTCIRIHPFKQSEQVNDIDYRHMGGIYRIQVR